MLAGGVLEICLDRVDAGTAQSLEAPYMPGYDFLRIRAQRARTQPGEVQIGVIQAVRRQRSNVAVSHALACRANLDDATPGQRGEVRPGRQGDVTGAAIHAVDDLTPDLVRTGVRVGTAKRQEAQEWLDHTRADL